jgi:putative addiction module component (TIGR02574 family)
VNATGTSIFDLSPAEKLQLVQDLWDDLAASEETVQVLDWQKEELALRKARLLAHPAPLRTWDQVKQAARSRRAP